MNFDASKTLSATDRVKFKLRKFIISTFISKQTLLIHFIHGSKMTEPVMYLVYCLFCFYSPLTFTLTCWLGLSIENENVMMYCTLFLF